MSCKAIAHIIGQDDVIEANNFLTGSEMVYKIKGHSEEPYYCYDKVKILFNVTVHSSRVC